MIDVVQIQADLKCSEIGIVGCPVQKQSGSVDGLAFREWSSKVCVDCLAKIPVKKALNFLVHYD